jgi:4-aminobutyrate aminotransferase-like enzyme
VATTPQYVFEEDTGTPSELQEKARRHLWMHFTRMGGYDSGHEIPIIVRGEGSYVYDEHDKRYLDGPPQRHRAGRADSRPRAR